MERKVLLIMADQCEEGEVAEILDIMRRVGFACDGVSIAGEYVTGQHGVRILADSGVNLKIIVDVREEDVFKAQRQLTRDIWALFMEKGIEIPFPQVVVHQG